MLFDAVADAAPLMLHELQLTLAVEVVRIQSRSQSRTSDPSLPLLETSFVIVESIFFRVFLRAIFHRVTSNLFTVY